MLKINKKIHLNLKKDAIYYMKQCKNDCKWMESEKFTQSENLQMFRPERKERLTAVNKWFLLR